MTKVGKIPEFTDGDNTSTEVVKEQDELETGTLEEEQTESEPTEGENQTVDDKSKEIIDNETSTESEKLVALEALRKTEEELDKDTSELDREIQARKDRIAEKRSERRQKRDLVETIGERLPETEVDNLGDIDSTTLSILERYTKAKGLVPRSEIEKVTYESQHKTAENAFYEKHKEYLPENDKDDTLYKALQRELALFAKPSNPGLISKLFEKAHSEVRKQYPQFFKESTLDNKINATQRTNVASMGSGNTGGSSRSKPTEGKKLTSFQIQALQQGGWTQEDIDRLNGK